MPSEERTMIFIINSIECEQIPQHGAILKPLGASFEK